MGGGGGVTAPSGGGIGGSSTMGERYREGQARGGKSEGLMEAAGLRGRGGETTTSASQMGSGAQGLGQQQQGKFSPGREEGRLLGATRAET